MDEIGQLKIVAFQKLAEAEIIPAENIFEVQPEVREKFEWFWRGFERNVVVCVKNMIAKERAEHNTPKRDWLIAIRKASGFTQKYVAQRVNIAAPSYCTIEKGISNPTVSTAKKIASVLGFDWTRFFEDGPTPHAMDLPSGGQEQDST